MKVSVWSAILIVGAYSVSWEVQPSGSEARFRGISAVSGDVAWASGSHGTFARTIDGRAWKSATVPGAAELDFRDVHAIDDKTAYLLASGPGEKSRILKTTDGGRTWISQLRNHDERVFLDALAFWDADHGLALGDPVDGRFVLFATTDGGASWSRIPSAGIPLALPGEGAFAASGTCLVTEGARNAWFGTGGAAESRIFRSTDRGRSWTIARTPINAGTSSSGIFSLAFSDALHGVAVGGDYKQPEGTGSNAAWTDDGGRTWNTVTAPAPTGYRSAVASIAGTTTVLAVGPKGSDISLDHGRTWRKLGSEGFHAVGFAPSTEVGWAVGEAGSIARFHDRR